MVGIALLDPPYGLKQAFVGWDKRWNSQRSDDCRIFAMLGIALLNPYMVSSQFAKALSFDDVAGCCHISGLFDEVLMTSGLDEHSRAAS